MIAGYRSMVTNRINAQRKTPGGPVWQRDYREHVIRSQRAQTAIREYIVNNPARWRLDRYNAPADGPDPMASELWRLLKEDT